MARVAFLAQGTRGDVQPLCAIGNYIKAVHDDWVVTIISHQAHQVGLYCLGHSSTLQNKLYEYPFMHWMACEG